MSKLTDDELLALLQDIESDRVERKASASERTKLNEAICAFANDLPDHRQPGVIFIGVHDNGSCAGLIITDQLLLDLAAIRDNGNILPLPAMTVQKKTLSGCEIAVIVVTPADSPPVRYSGRVRVRVGPRRAVASADEERRLAEKRRGRDLSFDLHPVQAATLDDLDIERFRREYLCASVAPDILEQNARSVEDQLRSLRLCSSDAPPIPTILGLLVCGKEPRDRLPGAYLQFLRIDGTDLTDPIRDQKDMSGPLTDVIRVLDEVLQANISVATDVSKPEEIRHPDYPIVALQQLTRNAVLHRNYDGTNAPIRITWFNDRIEIQNPGGPYGQVHVDNFGTGATDYRNPHLAEAMKNLGFVQKFGLGIPLARKQLEVNGNPPLEYDVQPAHVLAVVRRTRG